jgi:hypothetical protein
MSSAALQLSLSEGLALRDCELFVGVIDLFSWQLNNGF